MPSKPARAHKKLFAFASRVTLPAVRLPRVADLTAVFPIPGRVTVARMWVGLGALNGGAMAFWPYPKTYLWGLVLYVAALGLALAAGVWGARLSWDERLGGAHTIALGTVAWTITLGVALTLPLI